MNDKAKDARDLYVQALLKQWGENQDPAEAFRLYQASADLGFAGAQNCPTSACVRQIGVLD